jgi:diguanylate cyclase (GGDEF)-like protein
MALVTNSLAPAAEVVVVDDHPDNLELLVKLLGAHGYRVRAFPDAELALASVKLAVPDIVLLDIGLPIIDGFEACVRLRSDELTRELPIIFLSARVDTEDIVHGFEVGGSDYVTKPIRERELLARIRVHVRVKQLQDRLRQQSTVDSLTGLYNRRMLDETLATEWRRNLRQKSWLGVIIVDVDHFKLYNDNYGHQKGDLCLRAIAHSIATAARRSGDFVGRYGGEEFTIILPNTDRVGTGLVASRILEGVRNLRLEHAQSPTCEVATVSLGAVSMVPNRETAASGLIDIADRRLYLAKRQGRNRVVVDDEDSNSQVRDRLDAG